MKKSADIKTLNPQTETENGPFYLPLENEVELFEAAYTNRMGVMLKGPTGCGKTRFVRYMAFRLGLPVYTVSCHDDLSSSDLIGRFLIKGGETVWVDGPVTTAVRNGGICYLDEIVEARKDTTVIIHPLSDDRRILTIEKTGEELKAPDNFMLVISYNPAYQHMLKDLKPSTRQRFMALDFDYPPEDAETEIVMKESGIDKETARQLVSVTQRIRGVCELGLDTPPGTRLLVHAAALIMQGIDPREACSVAIIKPLTDDEETKRALYDLIDAAF